MSDSLKEAITRKFKDGIQEVEKGKTMEGLENILSVLASSWLLERDPDALMIHLALFSLGGRIEKLKDNKEFRGKWLKTLNKLAEALKANDKTSIYENIREMVSCVMKHVPRIEEKEKS